MLEYYFVLRSVLRTKPHLRRCLSRCRHCGIFFLTHPRNAGRKDVGCPFGCREAHRGQTSTRRSVEYYRGKEGKLKKRIQNGKRPPRGSRPHPKKERVSVSPAGEGSWNRPMLEHVRMVASLIEGRRVSLEEIGQMLARVLRQHRMARRRKIDQAVAWLNENPP